MSETVSRVISGLGRYLKSIDIRTLAFRLEDEWINIVTSLFFSEKPIEKIREEHKKLDLPEMDNIKLFYSAQEKWIGALSKGEIWIKDASRPLPFPLDAIIKTSCIDIFESPISLYPDHLRTYRDWRIFGVEKVDSLSKRDECWNYLDRNTSMVIPLSYRDIYDWIRHSLKITKFHRGDKIGFIIGIPIHAKISELKVKENRIKIKLISHKDLSNLFVNVYHMRYDNYYGRSVEINRKPVSLDDYQKISGDYVYYQEEVEFPELKPHDRIEVYLRNRKFPTSEIDVNHTIVPLEKPLEPFFLALNRFCEIEDFKKQLFTPETCPRTPHWKHDPAWLFEEAVVWLLSLAGLSVIRLGEKETIHLDTGINYSADILAYKENEYIYIIDCDIQHISLEKADHLLQIVDLLKPIQDEKGKPEIIPMIFTPKDPPVPAQIESKVQVYTGSRIKRLFEKIMKGEEIRL